MEEVIFHSPPGVAFFRRSFKRATLLLFGVPVFIYRMGLKSSGINAS